MSYNINRRTCLGWIVVCAVSPVVKTLRETAMGKVIKPDTPHADLIWYGMLVLILVSLFGPPVWQWMSLRAFAPRLKFWYWYLAIAFACFMWIGLLGFRSIRWDIDGTQFAAFVKYSPGAKWGLVNFLKLPWSDLFGSLIGNGLTWILIPSIVLSIRSSIPVHAFFLAGMAGMCTLVISQIISTLSGDCAPHIGYAVNGWNWESRCLAVCVWASLGAIEGAVNCSVLALLVHRKDKTVELRTPLMLLMWVTLVAIAVSIVARIFMHLLHPDYGICY